MGWILIAGLKCDTCGKAIPEDAKLAGTNMWHIHNWCCQHTTTATCPDCRKSAVSFCPICGRDEEYT